MFLHPPVPDGLDLTKENALTPLGDSQATRTGHSLEFFGLKEFSQGDDIRSISWSKTAQMGKLVLKTFELDTRPEIILVLNTDTRRIKGFGFGNNLKRAIKLAAGVLLAAYESGLTVFLVLPISEQPVLLTLLPSTTQQEFVFDLLAKLEGSEMVDLPLDPVLSILFAIQGRQTKVSFWSIDDAEMINFNEKQKDENMDKGFFIDRMEELGIPFRLLQAKKPPAPEIANSRNLQ
ncbi:DUF58 domain-containing protein [bacterium]|nr:DUF58 domain-containing protein [bacterium]